MSLRLCTKSSGGKYTGIHHVEAFVGMINSKRVYHFCCLWKMIIMYNARYMQLYTLRLLLLLLIPLLPKRFYHFDYVL